MKDVFDLSTTHDLPEELASHLKSMQRDEEEKKLIHLLKMAGRDLNLDEILVGYFRVWHEIKDRKKITVKLYNMTRAVSPEVETVPGKKGVYRYRNNDFEDLF